MAIMRFIANEWKFIVGMVLIVSILYVGYSEYREFIAKPSQTPTVAVQPQIVQHTTETIREVAIADPSQPGAVLEFVERNGKVIAIVNGQEVEVPNQTGQPNVEIGKNGELKISTTSTAKIDVTDMVRAQVIDAVNKQAEDDKKELAKEKAARKSERLLWIIGTAGAIYLMK